MAVLVCGLFWCHPTFATRICSFHLSNMTASTQNSYVHMFTTKYALASGIDYVLQTSPNRFFAPGPQWGNHVLQTAYFWPLSKHLSNPALVLRHEDKYPTLNIDDSQRLINNTAMLQWLNAVSSVPELELESRYSVFMLISNYMMLIDILKLVFKVKRGWYLLSATRLQVKLSSCSPCVSTVGAQWTFAPHPKYNFSCVDEA